MEANGPDDPIISDPTAVDWAYPPAIATVTLTSHGDNLNGVLYVSSGPGPHPTVILLHGYPGDEKNVDLAQAIRRAGSNVLIFHYRGAWGSNGAFSVDHALEDVSVALDYLSAPQSQHDHRIDPGRVALVGHSLGAYLALLAGSQIASVHRIAALTPVNLGRMIATSSPDDIPFIAQSFDVMGHGAIQGARFQEQFTKMMASPARYDLLEQLPGLDGKSVLLVGATRDEDVNPAWHYEPLLNHLKQRNQAHVTSVMLDADHVFSNARIALARVVTYWLASTEGIS